ncbi:MAG TPA: F0F1 ATP synthase subunit epsilon [Terriglobales bacterium]|jgi:F-type H+-transporting ATPase subunit epsilon
MADTFQLEIVTPERKVVSEQVEEVQLPGKKGYLGILAGHAPLITELAAGEITYRRTGDAKEQRLAVAWGFAEVLPDKTTLLAEIAERPEEIDVEAAKKLRALALERLRSASEVEDVHRYTREYEAAQTRLEVAARAGFADMANIVP